MQAGRAGNKSTAVLRLPHIDTFPQLLARLEVRNVLGRNLHLLPRSRVAADARWSVIQTEATQPSDFNPAAARQRPGHGIENHRNGSAGVAPVQLREATGQDSNEV